MVLGGFEDYDHVSLVCCRSFLCFPELPLELGHPRFESFDSLPERQDLAMQSWVVL